MVDEDEDKGAELLFLAVSVVLVVPGAVAASFELAKFRTKLDGQVFEGCNELNSFILLKAVSSGVYLAQGALMLVSTVMVALWRLHPTAQALAFIVLLPVVF